MNNEVKRIHTNRLKLQSQAELEALIDAYEQGIVHNTSMLNLCYDELNRRSEFTKDQNG